MTFDDHGRVIDERKRIARDLPQRYRLGQLIDDTAMESADTIASIVKLGVIGVAAFYAIPKLIDSLTRRRSR